MAVEIISWPNLYNRYVRGRPQGSKPRPPVYQWEHVSNWPCEPSNWTGSVLLITSYCLLIWSHILIAVVKHFHRTCSFTIWATSWENLFMPYANNIGADQPAHSRNLISPFVVCCLDSIIPILAKSKISRLWLVSVAEQASLSLTWSQTPKTGFLMMWLISRKLW